VPSRNFAIRIYGERTTPEQRRRAGPFGCMILYLGIIADARTQRFRINLRDFARWSGFGYTQVREAWQDAQTLALVQDVARSKHGFEATLSDIYQQGLSEDVTAAERGYKKVFKLVPHKIDRERIRETVGTNPADVKLWVGVCEEWRSGKHAPTNIEGLLDRFVKKRAARDAIQRAPVAEQSNVPDWAKE